MHQTKKGNEWRFGIKYLVGMDAGTELVYTIKVAPANTHDIKVIFRLICSDGEVLYGDPSYVGIQKHAEVREDEHLASLDYHIVCRAQSLSTISDNVIDWNRFIDHRKVSMRCKVKHIFRIVKHQFGYTKTAYCRLQKNANRLFSSFICSVLYMLECTGQTLKNLRLPDIGVLCPLAPFRSRFSIISRLKCCIHGQDCLL